jgi:predicted transposase YbfD/YdcC
VCHHWAIENNRHWTLDVIFKEDLSRLRKGHGAKNLSIKTRRNRASWDPRYLRDIFIKLPS